MRVLPVLAGAITLTIEGRFSLTARRATSWICARSVSRPTSGRLTRGLERALRGPSTRWAATGAVLPRALISIWSPNSKLLAARTVRSLARMPQGSAACCRRAAAVGAAPGVGEGAAGRARVGTASPVVAAEREGEAGGGGVWV